MGPMALIIRSYRLMFLVPVLLAVISCGGPQAHKTGGHDIALLMENADKSPPEVSPLEVSPPEVSPLEVSPLEVSLPVFVLKKEIKTTISDSTGDISIGDASGVRVRTFSYEEYENAPGRLPGARESLMNVYLIRQMDASGAVVTTRLTIERWSRFGRGKKVDTWKFHDGDMDGVPDKAVFALIAETRDNTLLDMHAVELEVGEAVSEYYRQRALEIRERGLEDAICGGACR